MHYYYCEALFDRTHQFLLLLIRHVFAEFEVRWTIHGLLDAEMRQKMVVLHDIARHLSKPAKVPRLIVDHDLASDIFAAISGQNVHKGTLACSTRTHNRAQITRIKFARNTLHNFDIIWKLYQRKYDEKHDTHSSVEMFKPYSITSF